MVETTKLLIKPQPQPLKQKIIQTNDKSKDKVACLTLSLNNHNMFNGNPTLKSRIESLLKEESPLNKEESLLNKEKSLLNKEESLLNL